MADEAAAQIRREIVSGRFAPGQRLHEQRIAEALGVSRGPVREAFKLLKAEGLVDEQPNKGTSVIRLTAADLGEIFEVRLAVETRAVKLIVRAHNEEDIDALRHQAEQLIEAAATYDDARIAQADVDFHEALCRLSRVERLRNIFRNNIILWKSVLLIDEHLYPVIADTSDEHFDIVRAIESGDEQNAVLTLESHLERCRERLMSYIASNDNN